MSTTKAFLIHKPIGALSSTVDSKLNSIIMNKDDPLCGQTYSNKGVTSRPTVYDYAQLAGFPTNFSLVGRLDVATSGIMLFTNDTILDKAIRDPPDDPLEANEYKTKEYKVVLLGQRLYNILDDALIDIEMEMSQPFSFNRRGQKYFTSKAYVKVIRKWQHPELTLGQKHLGWCIEVVVALKEGKHHQIRRMAKRSFFSVISLQRVRIAGILTLDSVPAPGQCRWLDDSEICELYRGLRLTTRSIA